MLELVKTLRTANVSVILISHNVEHVFEVCDRIAVLRHGKPVASLETDKTTHEEVVKYITGAASADKFLAPSRRAVQPGPEAAGMQ